VTFLPRGVPHAFVVEGERPARLLSICVPVGSRNTSRPPAGRPRTTGCRRTSRPTSHSCGAAVPSSA